MKKTLKTILFILIIIIPIFIINLIITEKVEESNYFEKAKKDVMTYLELRYGNGDYKIDKIKYIGGCDILGNCRPDGYKINLDTNYFDKSFNVVILKGTSQIYSDNFIEVLAKEKWDIDSDIYNYIAELAFDKLNEDISKKYNVKISFDNKEVDKNFDFLLYEKLPTVDDLIESTRFYDPKIEITADLTSESQLLEFLKDFTKYYIEEFSTNQFFYSQESKYFRYKFDYGKLGVEDYKDQYNGYGGYVFTNDNKTIRINIMGEVKEYTIEEILN